MLVRDIMKTDVATISPFATIREAMQQMRSRGVKSLVVEKQGEHDAWGIITYTTILRTIVAEEGDIDLVNVYDVCSKPAISVFSAMDVRHVARLMVNEDYRRVLVLNNNELEGIITMNDIVSAVLKMVDE
jgi:CBS domain-containing protein